MERSVARWLLPVAVTAFLIVVGGRPAMAQANPAPPAAPRQADDPFASELFVPELIMQHARAIGLDDRQRSAITQLITQLQGRVTSLQWQLAEQMQALKETLGRPTVDQDRALDQMNRVLETEKSIKRAHLEMLIKVKNILRADQKAALTRLRAGGASGPGDSNSDGGHTSHPERSEGSAVVL
jgi:Spy/CpxP family protein refolding chaperone